MSAIDTFNHVHVANFFEIPVYWVLKEGKLNSLTHNNQDEEKVINKYYLSIGGGSGEHPALILNNDALVFNFLSNVLEIEKPIENDAEYYLCDCKIAQLTDEIHDKYFETDINHNYLYEDVCQLKFNQNQWPLETFIDINKNFKANSKSKESLKTKIIEAAALFIIYEMPLEDCIKDSKLVEIAKMIKSACWKSVFNVREMREKFVGFTGVLDSQKCGKIDHDGDTVWGYSLNDWKNDQTK